MVTKEEIVVVTELLGISVKMANQLNSDFWYHGTTMEDALNIQETGVIANYNLGTQLDFGTGFYLTDTEDKAVPLIFIAFQSMMKNLLNLFFIIA